MIKGSMKELWVYYSSGIRTFNDLVVFVSKEFPEVSFEKLDIIFDKFAIHIVQKSE